MCCSWLFPHLIQAQISGPKRCKVSIVRPPPSRRLFSDVVDHAARQDLDLVGLKRQPVLVAPWFRALAHRGDAAPRCVRRHILKYLLPDLVTERLEAVGNIVPAFGRAGRKVPIDIALEAVVGLVGIALETVSIELEELS